MRANVGEWSSVVLIQYRSEIRDAHGGISIVYVDGPTIRASFEHIKSVETTTDNKLSVIDTFSLVSWNVPELDSYAKLIIDGEGYDILSIVRDKVKNLMNVTAVKGG